MNKAFINILPLKIRLNMGSWLFRHHYPHCVVVHIIFPYDQFFVVLGFILYYC